jgi:hypothetical protein
MDSQVRRIHTRMFHDASDLKLYTPERQIESSVWMLCMYSHSGAGLVPQMKGRTARLNMLAGDICARHGGGDAWELEPRSI